MYNIPVIIAAVVFLAVLLFYEKKRKHLKAGIAKTLTSLLFVVAASIQPCVHMYFCILIIAGLVFCLVGDIFLAFPQSSMFRVGLFAFLMGHVLYIVAFVSLAHISIWTLAGVLFVVVIGTKVFTQLRPHLGMIKIPVILYLVVISIMVVSALMIFGEPALNIRGRSMVFVGALSFFVSDIFVARQRILSESFLNRLIGLPLYYGGQFLLAFSIGLI